jgi:HEAT repeat protein
LALVAALAGSLPASASAAPLVYYTAEDVQAGGVSARALVPRMFEAKAGTAVERAEAVFAQLKGAAPQLYGTAQLTVAPDFATSGRATLATSGLSEADRQQVIDEVWSSLAVHGLKTLEVAGLDGALGREAVTLPVFTPVVAGWQALPPARWEGAFVDVAGVGTLTATEFYDRVGRSDKALQTALISLLGSGVPAAQVRVLGALDALGVTDPATVALPLIASPTKSVALAAVSALASRKTDPRVTEALAALVEGEADPEVKSAAVKVLVAAGNRKYEDYLAIDKLKDPDVGVVAQAVRKLVASKNASLAPALVPVLSHENVDVREEALTGVLSLGNTEAMEAGLQAKEVGADAKVKLAKGLAGKSDAARAVTGLSWLVANGQPADAVAAADALAERKATAAVPTLVAAFEAPGAEVRKAAARALGSIGDPAALEPLAKLVGSADKAEAAQAELAAQGILEGLSQNQVSERVGSQNPIVARLAVRALPKFANDGRNAPVMALLKEQLRSQDAASRQAAAYALARVKDESVIGDLLPLATDADPAVREQVAVALGWSQNPAAGETLVKLLGDADSDVKRAAAESIAQQKVVPARDVLLQYVQYGKPEVRRAVMRALSAIAQPEDKERLIEVFLNALFDQDVQVKLIVIEGLRPIRDQRVVTGLSGAVIDPNVEVQKAAITALAETKDANAMEGIARALFADSKEVKLLAIDALGQLGQENAVKPLREFIKNETDEELRKRATEVHDMF